MSGGDIVRHLEEDGTPKTSAVSGSLGEFDVSIYRPRIDAGAVRIERWARKNDPTDVHWRTLSSDNSTSIFGDSDSSRIVDTSGGKRRVFSWMLSRSYDACGNAIEYTYKEEDEKGLVDASGLLPVWEKDRPQEARRRQKYIKRVKYGNRASNRNLTTWEASAWPQDWMFELVFDYGEHKQDNPSADESRDWSVRQDAFSQSHAGFEIRTYRLCRRVLMFNHFLEQTGKPENLVFSTSLTYEGSPQRTVLTNLEMSGHSLDKNAPSSGPATYRTERLPPWSFKYTSTPEPDQLATMHARVFNLPELPGSKSRVSEWLDLDGEGMPGLLTRYQDGTLCYQRNSGLISSSSDEPQFGAPIVLAQHPNMTGGTFQDLDRNGHLHYVLRDKLNRLQGYFERSDSDTWSTYSDFPETPTTERSKDAVEIDLTGDGLADVLCAMDDSEALLWQQNLGKQGLSGYQRIHGGPKLSDQPRLTRTTDSQTHVANMTGSGPSDLVEISAASVTYWPNFGNGNFGSSVEMGNPPLLAAREDFDHSRVRLIDVDGSGTTDLLYILPAGGAALYYNLAGNSWSDRILIPQLPSLATPSSVFTLDILGKGTACLCWADTTTGTNAIHYLDLMGDTKPHLLQSYRNGMGSTCSVSYASSTKFYVDDAAQGLPWSTRLSTPVQCVSKTELRDAITGNSSCTEYVYHNGCYDPLEKQFTGFEMVEEFHSERLITGDSKPYEAPIKHTKSWFSVGLSLLIDESRFLTKSTVSSKVQGTSDGDFSAEWVYALRGVSLRSEIYSQDGSSKAKLPFQVQEISHELKVLQPRGSNKYSSVQVCPRETYTTQYERNMKDPRVTHDITLETTRYGDVMESVHAVYPRTVDTAFADVSKNQKAGNMSHTRCWFTNDVLEPYSFRKPAPWKQKEHEILNFPFNGNLSVEAARKFNFEGLPETKSTGTWKALRTENRAYFKGSLLEDRLGGGELEAHSLLDQTYALAFTPETLAKIKLGLQNCQVPGSVEDILAEGKYEKLKDGGDNWWVPSTRSLFCNPKSGAGAEGELKEARRSFYTPSFFVDLFGNVSRIKVDADFFLAVETEDALGSIISFENDYEHLQPVKIIDANLNATQIVLDPLGQTIASASLGKGSGEEEDVDSLQDLVLEISSSDVDAILLDPTGVSAWRALGSAESRTINCLTRYAAWEAKQKGNTQSNVQDTKSDQVSTPVAGSPESAFSVHISRDLSFRKSDKAEIHLSISYLSGLGAPFQEVELNDPNDVETRWHISGLAISDAHGGIIRAFQPCFASSPAPIPATRMKTGAVTAFYDAMSRSIASLSPDKTWSKTQHGPWDTTEYTAGDSVLQSRPQDDPDVGNFFARIQTDRYHPSWYDTNRSGTAQEKRAAEKSAIYADAPLITHIGSCGPPVRTVRTAGGETYTRSSVYDVSGNRTHDIDSRDRVVTKMVYNNLSHMLQTTGMDEGESWSLQDAQGGDLLAWNCRGYSFRVRYDALRREIERLAQKRAEPSKIITRLTYGESCPGADKLNLKSQVWKVEDQSGVRLSTHFDIRGHCLEQTFQPTQEYKKVVDWKTANALENTIYSHTWQYDYLGQVLEEKDSQGNGTRRTYDRQGHVQRVDFNPAKTGVWAPYLAKATFEADGLSSTVTYGNGVTTNLSYDKSRHLVSQQTTRASRDRREVLEDITHNYDCVGRRVFTCDKSGQDKYFSGAWAKPEWDYTYDVTGKLSAATGRAQIAGALGAGNQLRPHTSMNGLNPARNITDSSLLYQYLETYGYDREGNIQWMKHEAPNNAGVTSWTRNYFYEEQSLLSDDPKVKNNRLSRTAIGNKDEGQYAYTGDAGLAGCMTTLPRFSELEWDMHNMLAFSSTQRVNQGTPERTYYVYDHSGARGRKVTETAARAGEEARKLRDTLYLGGAELQAKGDGSELWVAQVTGDTTLAVVETSGTRQAPLPRFQIGDNMELDDKASLVSYEEYSPFGSVVYSAVYGEVEAPRAYRFARYEHDRETGLYHCGKRYYCPWLGRWTSPDPLGDVDGPNVYEYVNNDPINATDPSGTSRNEGDLEEEKAQENDSNAFKSKRKPFKIIQKGHFGGKLFVLRWFNKKMKPKAVKETLWSLSVVWKKLGFTDAQARANHAKVLTMKTDPPGEQHHIFQDSFKHFFEAVGIHPDTATLYVDRPVHSLFRVLHDNKWAAFFASFWTRVTGEIRGETRQRKLIEQLRNPNSDESKQLLIHLRHDPGTSLDKILTQACYNLLDSGFTPEKIEKSLAFHGVLEKERGVLLTYKKFKQLWAGEEQESRDSAMEEEETLRKAL